MESVYSLSVIEDPTHRTLNWVEKPIAGFVKSKKKLKGEMEGVYSLSVIDLKHETLSCLRAWERSAYESNRDDDQA